MGFKPLSAQQMASMLGDQPGTGQKSLWLDLKKDGDNATVIFTGAMHVQHGYTDGTRFVAGTPKNGEAPRTSTLLEVFELGQQRMMILRAAYRLARAVQEACADMARQGMMLSSQPVRIERVGIGTETQYRVTTMPRLKPEEEKDLEPLLGAQGAHIDLELACTRPRDALAAYEADVYACAPTPARSDDEGGDDLPF